VRALSSLSRRPIREALVRASASHALSFSQSQIHRSHLPCDLLRFSAGSIALHPPTLYHRLGACEPTSDLNLSFPRVVNCGHAPTVDACPGSGALKPAARGDRRPTPCVRLSARQSRRMIIVLLHVIYALHTLAAKAPPELVLALVPGYTPHTSASSPIALAATSQAAAPSVGA
jgi:hypothetical protein